ncbi:hypothetical protein ACFFRR_009923 [Megaselia abdita]
MQSNAYLNFMIILNVVLIEIKHSNADGYSFAKFIGPVAGAEQKIYAAKKHENNLNTNLNHGYRYGSRSVDVDGMDFFAKPDYHFSYGVEDSKTGVLQNHKETRNGDKVKGEYRVVDPDGSLRVVKYSADNNKGFQAEVIHDGKSIVHGRDSNDNYDSIHSHDSVDPVDPTYHDEDDDEDADEVEHDDEEYTEEDESDNDGEDGENDTDIEYEHKTNEGDEEYFHFDFEDDFY